MKRRAPIADSRNLRFYKTDNPSVLGGASGCPSGRYTKYEA